MMIKPVRLLLLIFLIHLQHGSFAQNKGKLFIIGGGDRPPALLQSMVNEAGLGPGDYVVVLPMSGENPDTSYYYFKLDFEAVNNSAVVNFNFTRSTIYRRSLLDSLERAKLVFITGGDQSRFMKIVGNSPVFESIHKAYSNGATIAGTSAGAAVMSREMITGNELTDTAYRATFRKLITNNLEIKPGLGLLTDVIIDQHFIVRSRYNRLFSALEKYPAYTCIGIDEATAILVKGDKATVVGDGQVMVFSHPEKLTITNGMIKWSDIRFGIFTRGDQFSIKPMPRQ